jgi:hypothetical protein
MKPPESIPNENSDLEYINEESEEYSVLLEKAKTREERQVIIFSILLIADQEKRTALLDLLNSFSNLPNAKEETKKINTETKEAVNELRQKIGLPPKYPI